jgi:polyvinyl alcohol dehydrogenase (cytochrome)
MPKIRIRCFFLASVAIVLIPSVFTSAQIVQWPVAGQGIANFRNQPAESFVSSTNVGSLIPKWVFTTGGDVSATPTVGPTAIFVPDWAGNLFAIDIATGTQIWSHQITDYDGHANAITRVSPAIYNISIIFGDGQSAGGTHNGANVMAIDQQTGALLWITQVDPHPAAIISGSPVIVGNVIYQGVSSMEEVLSNVSSYSCCTFRGSVVALNADTGKMLWQTFVVPDNKGVAGAYSGGPIWQPPAIDTTRNLLYIGTGNNYSVPASVETCRQQHPNDNNCAAPTDYFDTALALDLTTGAVKWAHRLYGYDVWTSACEGTDAPSSCPIPTGPDYDLSGSGPNLVGNIVGFAQKSGIYWALNPDTGATVWSKLVGPGGPLGGIQWGTATDGTNIYIASSNSSGKAYKFSNGQQVTWGFWTALNAATGKTLWQTLDPTSGSIDQGALSVANGIVYAGSFDSTGHMYALSSSTGAILWSYASGGSVIGGPSIVNGNLFWGSGYKRIPPGTTNNKVYDFTPAPGITVTAPINAAQVTSPVQFTATAASPNCASGVASMRIYTAPGVSAYTTDTASLNTAITLSPGTYNTVVQSWDNCGNIGKTFVTVTVASPEK